MKVYFLLLVGGKCLDILRVWLRQVLCPIWKAARTGVSFVVFGLAWRQFGSLGGHVGVPA